MDSTMIFPTGSIWQAQVTWLHDGRLMVDPEVDTIVDESTPAITRFQFRSLLRWDLFWNVYELQSYGDVLLALKITPKEVSGIQAVCYRFWPSPKGSL